MCQVLFTQEQKEKRKKKTQPKIKVAFQGGNSQYLKYTNYILNFSKACFSFFNYTDNQFSYDNKDNNPLIK